MKKKTLFAFGYNKFTWVSAWQVFEVLNARQKLITRTLQTRSGFIFKIPFRRSTFRFDKILLAVSQQYHKSFNSLFLIPFFWFFLLKKLTIFSKFFNVFYVYDWFNCINSPPSCVLDSTGSSHYLSLCSQSCCYLQSRDSTLVNLIHFALYCGDAVARSSLELVSGCAALNAQDSVGM